MRKIYFTLLCFVILMASCRKTENVGTTETMPKAARALSSGKN